MFVESQCKAGEEWAVTETESKGRCRVSGIPLPPPRHITSPDFLRWSGAVYISAPPSGRFTVDPARLPVLPPFSGGHHILHPSARGSGQTSLGEKSTQFLLRFIYYSSSNESSLHLNVTYTLHLLDCYALFMYLYYFMELAHIKKIDLLYQVPKFSLFQN